VVTAAPGSAAARRTLDSLTAVLDPDRADENVARSAAVALRVLLPRLGTADDSTWAQIRLGEANALAGDQAGACRALRGAQGTARTPSQRDAVRRLDTTLGC
jgi:hypothetical protein